MFVFRPRLCFQWISPPVHYCFHACIWNFWVRVLSRAMHWGCSSWLCCQPLTGVVHSELTRLALYSHAHWWRGFTGCAIVGLGCDERIFMVRKLVFVQENPRCCATVLATPCSVALCAFALLVFSSRPVLGVFVCDVLFSILSPCLFLVRH